MGHKPAILPIPAIHKKTGAAYRWPPPPLIFFFVSYVLPGFLRQFFGESAIVSSLAENATAGDGLDGRDIEIFLQALPLVKQFLDVFCIPQFIVFLVMSQANHEDLRQDVQVQFVPADDGTDAYAASLF